MLATGAMLGFVGNAFLGRTANLFEDAYSVYDNIVHGRLYSSSSIINGILGGEQRDALGALIEIGRDTFINSPLMLPYRLASHAGFAAMEWWNGDSSNAAMLLWTGVMGRRGGSKLGRLFDKKGIRAVYESVGRKLGRSYVKANNSSNSFLGSFQRGTAPKLVKNPEVTTELPTEVYVG